MRALSDEDPDAEEHVGDADADAFDGVASFAREGRSIVVFTAYDSDEDVFRAIRGGARGYLLKRGELITFWRQRFFIIEHKPGQRLR